MPLTNTAIAAARPKAKPFKLFDGGGLYLPRHRFVWACPHCGQWLPDYKAVTLNAVEKILPDLANASVFFMDRLSPAALVLAEEASKKGALIFFEPSAKSDEKLLGQVTKLAHIIKYADQRLDSLGKLVETSPSLRLEVQTMGEKGLRYRHRLAKQFSAWLHLDAIKAPVLADTCGSGDWCTTDILSTIADDGIASLLAAGASGIREGLRYGQALAAWNCGFEGARGGMYAMDRKAFDRRSPRCWKAKNTICPNPARDGAPQRLLAQRVRRTRALQRYFPIAQSVSDRRPRIELAGVFQVISDTRQPAGREVPDCRVERNHALGCCIAAFARPTRWVGIPLVPIIEQRPGAGKFSMAAVPAIKMTGTDAQHGFHLCHGVREFVVNVQFDSRDAKTGEPLKPIEHAFMVVKVLNLVVDRVTETPDSGLH